jgi:hypothetical protein
MLKNAWGEFRLAMRSRIWDSGILKSAEISEIDKASDDMANPFVISDSLASHVYVEASGVTARESFARPPGKKPVNQQRLLVPVLG